MASPQAFHQECQLVTSILYPLATKCQPDLILLDHLAVTNKHSSHLHAFELFPDALIVHSFNLPRVVLGKVKQAGVTV
jgi:hypothetical protein